MYTGEVDGVERQQRRETSSRTNFVVTVTELNRDLSVSLFSPLTPFVFFFPSVFFSVCLLCLFVSEELYGCAYIMCNPAGQ